MKRVAITGGIGAGKSAAARLAGERGYDIVDADVLARRVVQKGKPGWRALRDAFGEGLFIDGELDRTLLADIVFHDTTALRRLNAITHPLIGEEIRNEISASTSEAVFIELPLFRREHRQLLGLDEVWAVHVDPDTAPERLITQRGFTLRDARARLSSQMSNDERAEMVDVVLCNAGTLDELAHELDAALAKLFQS